MARQLRRKRPGARGVEGILEQEIGKVLATLDHWPPTDEAIHGARKRLKRARAALRLARSALGERLYRRENLALRDASRPLSALRDAAVLVKTLDAIHGNGAATLRDILESHRKASRRRILADPASLKPVTSALRSARRRAARARLRAHGWDTLGRGLHRTYRTGRRAFVATRTRPTTERLHEWRKQAKYLRHALEILTPIAPKELDALARRAHRLSDGLGEDHDLAVLRDRVARETEIDAPTREVILARIDRRRRTLQRRALMLGGVVYREPSRILEHRLARHWTEWKTGSK